MKLKPILIVGAILADLILIVVAWSAQISVALKVVNLRIQIEGVYNALFLALVTATPLIFIQYRRGRRQHVYVPIAIAGILAGTFFFQVFGVVGTWFLLISAYQAKLLIVGGALMVVLSFVFGLIGPGLRFLHLSR
jgi:hypothetical protein